MSSYLGIQIFQEIFRSNYKKFTLTNQCSTTVIADYFPIRLNNILSILNEMTTIIVLLVSIKKTCLKE